MAGTTTRGYPFPSPGDPADGPSNIQSLASAINNDVTAVLGGQQLNVVTYGATGNGTTDDGAAIQSALNAAAALAAAHNGCTVIFPPGKYKMNQRLVIRTGVSIWAYGAYIFRAGTGGLLANFDVSIPDSYAGYAGMSNINVFGGIWDAQAQLAAVNAAFDTMVFNHCRNITVRDVTFRNTASDHALEFNSTDGGRAINCRFEGFKDCTAGLTRQFSEALQIDCAVSGSSSIGLFDGTHAKNIRMQGCYMGPAIDGSGLGSFGKLAGGHTTATGQFYDNIHIIDNVCDGSLDVGIQAYNWRNSIIAFNTILNTGAQGILATVPDPAVVAFSTLSTGIIISGNTLSGTATASIQVTGYTATANVGDVTIAGNAVKSSTTTGIFINRAGAGINVVNNNVDTTASNCINVSGTIGVLVKGNNVANAAANYGIFLGQLTTPTNNSTDCLVEGNIVTSCVTAGMRLSTGCAGVFIVGNQVRKGAAGSAIAVSVATGAGLTNTITQNDFTGYGSNANTITITSGTINKTIANDANVGTNLF